MSNRSNINITGSAVTGENIGGGISIFAGKTCGTNMQFKSIFATGSLSVISGATSLTLHGSASGDTVITGATNGLSTFGTFIGGLNVGLGGTLTGDTIFDGTASKFHLQYAGDYSSNFTARSIPDVGWVTGNTGGGTITGATNGLSTSGANIALGGELTGDTTIGGGGGSYGLHLGGASMLSGLTACVLSCINFQTASNQSICIAPSGMYILDNLNNKGFEYVSDYDANFTCRSLVDAQYVTGKTSQADCAIAIAPVAITGATNGLSKTDCHNVGLGGCLCCSTTIDLFGNILTICGVPGSAFIQLDDPTTSACFGTNVAGSSTELRNDIYNLSFSLAGGATFSDCNCVGLCYAGDYSANYQCLSIPNAGWVTGNTGGGTITGGTNGLHVEGKNITLGGALTGDTALTGVFTLNICNGAQLNTTYGYQISGQTILRTSSQSINFSDLNIAIGIQTLQSTTDGTGNIAIGTTVMPLNTVGGNNIAIGSNLLYQNTSGNTNIAIGNQTMFLNTVGSSNLAMGQNAMYSNMTGSFNIALGDTALYCNVNGDNNIAIGCRAGYLSSGSSNIFIGKCAGYSEGGSNKLYISNSSTARPLIHGDFSAKCITINGQLAITGVTTCNTANTALIWNSGTSVVHGFPIIDEWVGSEVELLFAGQKFAYPTQTIMQTDVSTCITIPNYIQICNINLQNVGDTAIFTIPSGKTALLNRAKLIILNNASPTCFSISIGNNACIPVPNCSYNNLANLQQISDVLQNETYELDLSTRHQAVPATSGSTVFFRVGSGSTSICNLCAHLLIEGFVY